MEEINLFREKLQQHLHWNSARLAFVSIFLRVECGLNCTWEVSKRAETQKGFVVESKRWVAVRTFAWIGKYRRLSKEYEFYENTSESFIYLALIRKMLRNLTAVNSYSLPSVRLGR